MSELKKCPFCGKKPMEFDGKLVKEPYIDGRKWLEFPKGA